MYDIKVLIACKILYILVLNVEPFTAIVQIKPQNVQRTKKKTDKHTDYIAILQLHMNYE